MLQITIFDTKIEYFLPRKNIPILDPNLPIWKPKSPYSSPRKYHVYVAGSEANRMADSADSDQTATLFAQTFLSKY